MHRTTILDSVSSDGLRLMLWGMTTLPLPELVRRRVIESAAGNQAAYARRLGLSPSYVSALLKDKVSLPGADKRRALADDIGISHVALLVAAGELTEEEAGPQVAPPFDPDDPRSVIVADLRSLTDPDEIDHLAATLSYLLKAHRARKGSPLA